MKVLILNGSARAPKGITTKLATAFAEGLSISGADVIKIEIQGLRISPCSACLACMHKTFGRCVIDDDMGPIYETLKSSDILVLATPVYFDNMTAQAKTVMDRCICSMEPFLRKDDAGRVRHPYFWRMPSRFVLIATSAFPEKKTFAPLISTYRAQASNLGSQVIGEMCIPGSVALQMKNNALDHHFQILQDAGSMLVKTGKLTKKLLAQINTPPMTEKEYFEAARDYEIWCRNKLNECRKSARGFAE